MSGASTRHGDRLPERLGLGGRHDERGVPRTEDDMAAGSGSIDALSQFRLTTALGPVGASVNFTQGNLMMLVTCVLVLGTLWLGMRPKALVPGRLQALAELAYD